MIPAVATGDAIIRAGAIAGALVAILGLIAMILRFSVKQLTSAVKTELRESVEPRIEQVYQNTMELKPNGGSTVADAVRRLEATTRELVEEQRHQRIEISKNREAIESTRAVVIEHLADHRRLPPLS